MAIENAGLREMVVALVEDNMTIYLHTGDPGSAGTSNRVPSSALRPQTITGGSGWTVHGTRGRANVAANISFGNAGAAVTNVSWYSLFKGSTFIARRQLAGSGTNIANGAPVSLTGSTIVIEVTSSDS